MVKREGKGETDHSAAHPKDWPGIPGRSSDHEGHPESPKQDAQDADVTEQQRRLEQEQHQVERK